MRRPSSSSTLSAAFLSRSCSSSSVSPSVATTTATPTKGFRGDKLLRRAGRPLAAFYCSILVAALIVGQMIQTISCLQTTQQQLQRQQDSSPQARAQQLSDQQPAARQQQLGGGGGGAMNAIGQVANNGFAADFIGGPADSSMLISGYLNNNKRARKMSAFMPMRGRKDGRDYRWQQQRQLEQPPTTDDASSGAGYLPLRESDESDASILRLAMAAAAANQAYGGGATPRSFVDQMAARRAAQQQQPIVSSGGEAVFEPGTNSLVLDPAPAVMQAKLRRAFHPMRGKKFDSSWPSSLLPSTVDQLLLADQLQLQDQAAAAAAAGSELDM